MVGRVLEGARAPARRLEEADGASYDAQHGLRGRKKIVSRFSTGSPKVQACVCLDAPATCATRILTTRKLHTIGIFAV